MKPWLGSELAVPVLPPLAGGKVPAPLLLIKVNDQAKAKAALDKAAGKTCAGSATSTAHAPRYRLVKDFAVVVNEAKSADDAPILDRVAGQAQKNDGGLANTAGFATIVNKLANDRLAVGWVDTKAVTKLAMQSTKSATSSLGGLNLTGANCDLASFGSPTAPTPVTWPSTGERRLRRSSSRDSPTGASPGRPGAGSS